MMHEYVLFSSRLASFAYSQVHDECWPVFDKRIQAALSMGKTIGKKYALRIYDQSASYTSCFCGNTM